MNDFRYRVAAPKGKLIRSPERVQADMEATKTSLMAFLEARRARLGQTAEDMIQSPEAALKRQEEKIRAEQRKLVDDYMQTTASVDTM